MKIRRAGAGQGGAKKRVNQMTKTPIFDYFLFSSISCIMCSISDFLALLSAEKEFNFIIFRCGLQTTTMKMRVNG